MGTGGKCMLRCRRARNLGPLHTRGRPPIEELFEKIVAHLEKTAGEAQRPALIVTGGRRRPRTARRLSLGSVSNDALRVTDGSVLIAPPRTDPR
jgi:nucleotide-binding universal stress UspA family protein